MSRFAIVGTVRYGEAIFALPGNDLSTILWFMTLQKCESATLREEIFAKKNFAEGIFAEFIFEIYDLICKSLFRKND